MKKNKKYNLTALILFFIFFFNFAEASSKDSLNFLSLKNSKVNLRLGPSFEYPIKLTYIKKYLPVIIIDKSETWRHIKDFENNSGWINISQLSKKKTALNLKNNSILYKKPTIYSKPLAKLETGRLVLINKCRLKWCKISSANHSGWIKKKFLWGKTN